MEPFCPFFYSSKCFFMWKGEEGMDLLTWVLILVVLLVILKILRIISKMFFKAASVILTCMFFARLWMLLQ